MLVFKVNNITFTANREVKFANWLVLWWRNARVTSDSNRTNDRSSGTTCSLTRQDHV